MTLQRQEKVQLLLSLRCSPQTLSIQDHTPSTPLKLIATIRQVASPFPDHVVTILTYFPLLPLRSLGSRITHIRVSGDPDLLKRDKSDGFSFLSIPPVYQSYAEVVFELPPERLMQRLGNKDESVQDKLRRIIKGKKIARWTLPDELSLDREPDEDETEEIACKLRDLVDHHVVNSLSSRGAVEDEQKPDIGRMRSEGWGFGEPEAGLVMVVADEGEEATFTIVE
ncbi:hypothetical protein BU23DRAFT_579500 [Bimuria novae-zelandiae CBS 107.79]|uniref:Uncharacterized protein n=1 Tax=Bimuria novae-zelandiae CBS 107.79 TaxID=1447943 RepID=A0A6A5VMX1_9PLEO|nr:hypothetical protein BU23DRAFT_579500 [Bimuria novae-zelandiae CBS 107.79]